MSEDHLQFLKENFILDYEEAVEEFHEELPLRLHFQEILEILNQNTITLSTPIRMKRPLYGLKYALAECVMLAEKEREKEMERKVQNKRSLPSISNTYNFVKNHWFLFRTWRKLLHIKEQLLQGFADDNDAAAAASSTDQSLVRIHQPWDYQFFLKNEIYGFNDHLQKIEAFLLNDGPANSYGIKTLGIVGMGGSGKTALAKKVFCSSRVQESFYPMIWVELPLSPIPLQSIVTIVCERVSSCGMNDHDNDLGILLCKMHDRLLNAKYLIVLDGVWHASDWCLDLNSNSNLQIEGTDHFQHGLPKDSGGAIIITSRFQDVATKIVGEQNLYHLQPTLDKDSCWSLILDSMPKTIYQDPRWSIPDSMHKIINQYSRWSSILDSMLKVLLHPTLARMKDEMVDRCDGLPLAAKALAEIVSKKFTEEGLLLTGETTRDQIMSVFQIFCLRINKPHQIPISEVLEYLRTYKGVLDVHFPFDQNNYVEVVVKAEIFFDPRKLVARLSRFPCVAEIVSPVRVYYDSWDGRWRLVEDSRKRPCEGEITSSMEIYKDGRWGDIVVSILPHMFNQLLDMKPLSPTLHIDRFVLFFFLNPNVTKEFCLRVHDSYCYCEALRYLKAHPDVSEVVMLQKLGKKEIRVKTNYNPLEIMKDLRKHYVAEISSSCIIANYGQGMNRIGSKNENIIKLWRLPEMIQKEVNSQINNSPSSHSPSPFLSCILELFQDSSIIKRFRLRFDTDDDTFSLKILKNIYAYPGVCDAYIDFDNINEIEGEGWCNLLELMRYLNKLVKTEIISFLKMS